MVMGVSAVTMWIYVLVGTELSSSTEASPSPWSIKSCTELKPLDLLQSAASKDGTLHPGLEIRYDVTDSAHAYWFASLATSSALNASDFLVHCDHFPEEFSILINVRFRRKPTKKQQCLLALKSRHSVSADFTIDVHWDVLRVALSGPILRTSPYPRTVNFQIKRLLDKKWHSLILEVAGSTVSLRVDCGPYEVHEINDDVSTYIHAADHVVHVGSCDEEASGVFQGMLRHMVLYPGADISLLACPLLDGSPIGGPITTPGVLGRGCEWADTGKVSFDPRSDSLQVCHSGVWQQYAYSTPTDKQSLRRLDYVVWHQDLVTAAPTIDVEVFHIPDEGLFLATASFDDRVHSNQQSAIFKWQNGYFRLYQSVQTLGAQCWEFFRIKKRFFLAVANQGNRRDSSFNSTIYVWSHKRGNFRWFQDLVTWTARDIEHLEINGRHYLAVANHANGSYHEIYSHLYKWNAGDKRFLLHQRLATIGAYDFTSFHIAELSFLIVANSFTGPPADTTILESVVYLWKSNRFTPIYSIETVGATDWEFFSIGDEYFLVVANALYHNPRVPSEVDRFYVNSTIYRLDIVHMTMQVYQNIPTNSAVDWEFFIVGEDYYLIASDAQQADHVTSPEATDWRGGSHNMVYRWQGVEKFVVVHHLDVLPSADWESFTVDDNIYLVYANPKDSISQIYKLKLI